jgi:hypothetical protein
MRPLVALALLASGCVADDIGCRVDSECGEQVCVAGACIDKAGTQSGPNALDGGAGNDLAQPTSAPDGFAADAFSGSCPFNGDGVLQRAEIPAMPGLGGFFMATPSDESTTVDLTKKSGGWDFSGSKPGDTKVFDGLSSPTGAWWQSSFPEASYGQLLDAETGYLGIYQIDDGHLYLLGVVSPDPGFYRTELSYDPKIDVLRFPLANGDHWTVTSNVSGLASGIGFFATETWAMAVDDRGQAKTPAATFDALRLRVDYEQVYGLAVTHRISYLFLAECYGVVTRVRSTAGETSGNFTKASEYRRLAAP